VKTTIHMRNKIALALALAAPVILIGISGLTRVDAQLAPQPTGPAGKAFKNIKVLKDLPAEKLIPTMHAWNDSLGVKCDFCHTVDANHKGYERDDKPTKNAARGMVTMLMDLNKHQKALGGRGTCFMCHHGKPEPELRPEGGAERR
jgi:hypothetical protein